jgi:hypothetical protein
MAAKPRFPNALQRHLAAWAASSGYAECVEASPSHSWVLRKEHRERNLYDPQWWRYISGLEHRWARALNSSQCFAVNLFGPLTDNLRNAVPFLQQMLPDRHVADADDIRVTFEHSPPGIASVLGERGQPTQIDVFFEVVREEHLVGCVGVEVKLSETEFGCCRGYAGRRDGRPVNPQRDRCLSLRSVLESPETQCYMAEVEGRKYWGQLTSAGSSMQLDRIPEDNPCPFRHGLYQLMRNRVTLEAFQTAVGAEWCELVVCIHPSNATVTTLPEPVVGTDDALDAFRLLTNTGAIRRWDAADVLRAMTSDQTTHRDWANWMEGKYLLAGP